MRTLPPSAATFLATPTRTTSVSERVLAASAVFVAISIATRFAFLNERFLNIDEAAHLLGARTLLDGDRLYVDFADNKPPLVYAVYALAQLLGGPGLDSVRWFGAIVLVPSIALAALAYFRFERAGVAAGVAFVVASSTLFASPMAQPAHELTQLSVVALQKVPAPHASNPGSQLSVASLQDSTPVHAMPSSQLRAAPTQRPAEHTSFSVQNEPSSQVPPSRVLHIARDTEGSQISHEFAGFATPAAKQPPPIAQPAHSSTQLSVSGAQNVPGAHVVSDATHALLTSSHVSMPSHETPLSQLRAVPRHALARQLSPTVQNSPSSQLAPSYALQLLAERAIAQSSHSLPGLRSPSAKQTPSIVQPAQVLEHSPLERSHTVLPAHVEAPGSHASVVSLQRSVPVHATPSSHERAAPPRQTPAEHTSPVVQNAPSSQLTPSLSAKAVRLELGRQISQGLAGLAAPARKHTPSTRHPVAHSRGVPASSSGSTTWASGSAPASSSMRLIGGTPPLHPAIHPPIHAAALSARPHPILTFLLVIVDCPSGPRAGVARRAERTAGNHEADRASEAILEVGAQW